MGITLLGPVELRTGDGSPAAVAGAKRRAVLALLALELGQVVPVERFFELLWDGQPPAQAKAALQGHVAALRKVLDGTGFTLHTQAPGYRLTGDPEQVDTARFAALATRLPATADDATAAGLARQALDLWRGPALAGLPEGVLATSLAARLEDARTSVVEAWAERLLRLGDGASAIPALEQTVRADGLREAAVALLIRCLAQAGRHAEALAVYQDARTRLADELGVDPGPALRSAHRSLPGTEAGAAHPGAGLSPAAPSTPGAPAAQPAAAPRSGGTGTRLPRRPSGFVGRALESHWLDQECGPQRTGSGLGLVIGPAGAGKSATVVHWAHGAAAGFPDGLLFTDLRGFDPAGPADPAETLGRFLRALGLPDDAIPEDPAARAELYQDQTADRRLLVVLDNVRTAADARMLLPAGPHCATVITSRATLEELVVTAGATALRLGALPDRDALGLLERLLTPGRVRAELAAAERLVILCDRLPLALRIAAARLVSRPGWTIADLVDELADERTRLLALDAQGTASVHTALTLTYRHLPADAAQLLALLAVHPGTEVDVCAAAALLGTEAAAARHALGALAAHHLLAESAPGRYARHDLIRLFARQLLTEHGPQTGRAALTRLLDHYLTAADLACERVQPGNELPQPPPAHPPRALPRLPDARSALAWFAAEEATIRDLVSTVAAADPMDGGDDRAWRLASLCNGLYQGVGRLTDRLACLRAGLRAARRADNRLGIALLEARTAGALATARPAEARPLAEAAVARTGPADGAVHAQILTMQAVVARHQGDLDEAADLLDRAVAVVRAGDAGLAGASVLNNAAAVNGMRGRLETALAYAREVRALLAEHPESTFHLSAMINESHALQSLGRSAEAEAAWTATLDRCRAAGSLALEAMTEQQFGEFLLSVDRAADAAEHLRAAIGLFEQRSDPAHLEQLRRQLAAIEGAPGAGRRDPRNSGPPG
ncbi:BTAD domain-containing putative transcriptional regulator [Kitasatospora sp. LaBMicrA B282]|uniref:AfsR/SARP family transcriptional regulator n=1 Tax=Kitasatospora sp. LaBMicrA B282 TaxID=3420949 RepID=UPI003D0E5FF1